jgi:Hemagglutinin repeat
VKLTYDGGWGGSLSANEASGKSNGDSTTWLNSQLTAGGTAIITTPSALLLQGADLNAHRVEISAGSLGIISLQDSATTSASNQNAGLSISASESGTVSGNVSAGMGNSRSSFLSVEQQTGIYAGTGGFGINIAGNTNLVGGVIASQAPANDNSLTTGTLSVSNLKNSYSFSGNSLYLSGGFSSSDRKNASGAVLGITDNTGEGSVGAGMNIPSAFSLDNYETSTTYSAVEGNITVKNASSDSLVNLLRDASTANNPILNLSKNDQSNFMKGIRGSQILSDQINIGLQNFISRQKANAREDKLQKLINQLNVLNAGKQGDKLNDVKKVGDYSNSSYDENTNNGNGCNSNANGDEIIVCGIKPQEQLSSTQFFQKPVLNQAYDWWYGPASARYDNTQLGNSINIIDKSALAKSKIGQKLDAIIHKLNQENKIVFETTNYGKDPSWGYWDGDKIHLDNSLQGNALSLAVVIVHEATHAYYDSKGDSIAEETAAFGNEVILYAELKKLNPTYTMQGENKFLKAFNLSPTNFWFEVLNLYSNGYSNPNLRECSNNPKIILDKPYGVPELCNEK